MLVITKCFDPPLRVVERLAHAFQIPGSSCTADPRINLCKKPALKLSPAPTVIDRLNWKSKER